MGCASIGAGCAAEENTGGRLESADRIFDSSESSRLMREAISTVMVVREARAGVDFLKPLLETRRKLMAALGTVDEKGNSARERQSSDCVSV